MFITNSKININKKCKYLDVEEDRHRTTSYPVCRCKMKYCKDYNGYCPIKND